MKLTRLSMMDSTAHVIYEIAKAMQPMSDTYELNKRCTAGNRRKFQVGLAEELIAKGKQMMKAELEQGLPVPTNPILRMEQQSHNSQHDRVKMNASRTCSCCYHMSSRKNSDRRRKFQLQRKLKCKATRMRCLSCERYICNTCHAKNLWDHELCVVRNPHAATHVLIDSRPQQQHELTVPQQLQQLMQQQQQLLQQQLILIQQAQLHR